MIDQALLNKLASIVGKENVHSGPAQLIAYSYDGTFQQHKPDVVVSPRTTEEVAEIMKLAYVQEVPVITRGAATGLAGGVIPVTGGIVLNLAKMNRILEIDQNNNMVVAEPGVVTADLQCAVESVGLFYPPDPASIHQCTIGGNVACNSGGPRCLKYGVTRDYVVGVTVVLADGRVLQWGGKLRKNSTGYNLGQLFVGSEGTLGVVTQVTLRLLSLPRERATAAAYFTSLDEASHAVNEVMKAGILPATLELMDNATINGVEDYLKLGLPRQAQAMLLFEQDGNHPSLVASEGEAIAGICREHGAFLVQVASNREQGEKLWEARRAVTGALGRLSPNKLGEDVIVPRSRLIALVQRIKEISGETGLPIPVFGHAGDGNLHPNILFDYKRSGEIERVEKAAGDILRAALELGGTLSGEHGIGTLKREFMKDAVGDVGLSVMKDLKSALDPKGILNPQKLFPQEDREGHQGFLTALPTLDDIMPG